MFCSGRISCFFCYLGALSFTALAGGSRRNSYRGVTGIESERKRFPMHVASTWCSKPEGAWNPFRSRPGRNSGTRLHHRVEVLKKQEAQVALNGHFYVPFPSLG